MTDIPTIEPLSFESGLTVKWTKDLSEDYPADDGWSLQYNFINSSGKFTVNAVADGKQFSNTISAATSAAISSGIYQWTARVTKDGEVYQVGTGHCEVLKNLAVLTATEVRTHVKKVLDAIEAIIENRASKDQMGYTIEGRTLERTPIPDLLTLRAKYKAEYERELTAEKISRGEATGRRVLVRF